MHDSTSRAFSKLTKLQGNFIALPINRILHFFGGMCAGLLQ